MELDEISREIINLSPADALIFAVWCNGESNACAHAKKHSESGIAPYDSSFDIACRASWFHIDDAGRWADHSNPSSYGIDRRAAEQQQLDKIKEILKPKKENDCEQS